MRVCESLQSDFPAQVFPQTTLAAWPSCAHPSPRGDFQGFETTGFLKEKNSLVMCTHAAFLGRNQSCHTLSCELKEISAPAHAATCITCHPQDGSNQISKRVKER